MLRASTGAATLLVTALVLRSSPGSFHRGEQLVLAAWNDFFYPLIILHDPNKFTVALGMQNLIANTLNTSGNSAFSSFGVMLAALTIAIVPIIVVYTLMQRQFISGLTAGALKG